MKEYPGKIWPYLNFLQFYHVQDAEVNATDENQVREGQYMWVLFGRGTRALEGGPSERQHLVGVGREDSEWG